LALNVFASCGTIFINKYVFKVHGFNFGTTLTVFHFIITFLLCVASAYLGFFTFKKLEILRVLPISFAFCGYVVFNNLSLLYNSVSFYQVMKILGTPAIVFVQDRFYNTPTDFHTKLTLIPICIGCAIAVVTDLEINLVGTLWAIAAVGSNSMYTIWGKTKMNELDANPMQILLYQSGTSAIMLIFCIPFFDDLSLIRAYEFNTANTSWIFFSCLTAFLVNFSFFLMSSVTTPLTINVLGYVKTCIVFIGGFYIFAQALDGKNIAGVIMTLLGFLAYTYVKMYPPAKPTTVMTIPIEKI